MIKDGRAYTCEGKYSSIDNKLIYEVGDHITAVPNMLRISEWIKKEILPGRGIFRSTSYGLKHLLHEDIGIYLTNNQFKDAMLLAGYYPVDPNELNWRFRIKLRREVAIKNPNPFFQWAKKIKEDSLKGDFVKDMISDKDFPVFADYRIIKDYLMWCRHACTEALDAFEQLWFTYEAESTPKDTK